jgi:hypothetical protein
MADPIGNSGAKSSGAFQAAADRLDRLVQGVKDQQLSETRSGPKIASPDSLVASPQEIWARQFMTQSIGPVAPRATFSPVPSYVPLAYPPVAQPDAGAGFSRVEPKGKTAFSPAVRRNTGHKQDQTIGAVLGKPVKKRSWVGRFLLGS